MVNIKKKGVMDSLKKEFDFSTILIEILFRLKIYEYLLNKPENLLAAEDGIYTLVK
jgi:hypothetical protein